MSKRGSTLILITAAMLFTCSCRTIEPVKVPSVVAPQALSFATPSEFDSEVTVPSLEQVFKLTQQQLIQYHAFTQQPEIALLPRHIRIAEYMEAISEKFNYYGNTYLASDALEKQQGNCMSLAILTKALARIEQVEVEYNKVYSEPVYQKRNTIVIRGNHVRSKLIDPDFIQPAGFLVINKPSVIIDYFPENGGQLSGKIKSSEFHAMIYSNLAAEAYIRKQYDFAYFSAREALRYEPKFSPALNTLALSLNRKGLQQLATEVFEFGFLYAEPNVELLSNYKQFLQRQEMNEKALAVDQVLRSQSLPNPFDYIVLGFDYLTEQSFSKAEQSFQNAIKLAPYLHQPYFGLAQLALEQNDPEQARQWLEKALEKSFIHDERQRYRSKLKAISVQ